MKFPRMNLHRILQQKLLKKLNFKTAVFFGKQPFSQYQKGNKQAVDKKEITRSGLTILVDSVNIEWIMTILGTYTFF